MKRQFRAESLWIHFQALLESPYLRAPWHITTTYLEDRVNILPNGLLVGFAPYVD
jgi:hypothetical protein